MREFSYLNFLLVCSIFSNIHKRFVIVAGIANTIPKIINSETVLRLDLSI